MVSVLCEPSSVWSMVATEVPCAPSRSQAVSELITVDALTAADLEVGLLNVVMPTENNADDSMSMSHSSSTLSLSLPNQEEDSLIDTIISNDHTSNDDATTTTMATAVAAAASVLAAKAVAHASSSGSTSTSASSSLASASGSSLSISSSSCSLSSSKLAGAAAAPGASSHNLGDCKAALQRIVDWEQASKTKTTWGTSAVLQQHQQHGSSNNSSSGIVGRVPSGAGCKRQRPGTLGRTNHHQQQQHHSHHHQQPLHACSANVDEEEEGPSPQDFLWQILKERGYDTDPMDANEQSFFHPPTTKQVEDYDLALVNAVKAGDLEGLRSLVATGRQMDACNRHGESIVHLSCRRGQADTLRFLLENGGRVHMCDDLGRTPLHDACWAKTPVFDCISIILDADPRLIRVVDCRGASPLAYIRREHWSEWRQFFDSKKEKYWAPMGGAAERNPDMNSISSHHSSKSDPVNSSSNSSSSVGQAEPSTAEAAVGAAAEEEEQEAGPQATRMSARQQLRKRSRGDAVSVSASS